MEPKERVKMVNLYYIAEPLFDKIVDEFNKLYLDEFIIYTARTSRAVCVYHAFCIKVDKITTNVKNLIESGDVEFHVKGFKPAKFMDKLKEAITKFNGRQTGSTSDQAECLRPFSINRAWEEVQHEIQRKAQANNGSC